MKIEHSKKTKIVLIVVLVLAPLLAGTVLFYVLYHQSPEESQKPPVNSDQTSDSQQTQNIKDNPNTKEQQPNTDAPPKTITNEATNKQQVQMVVSTNTQNGVVYIRGGINYPVVDGSCYALLSGPAGQSIRKNTDLLTGPASADCKTIAIPVGELSPGRWTLKLHYASDSYEGTSNEISFNI